MAEIEVDLKETAEGVTRVPANIMGLLRQSYDTREKVLDWFLAIGVAVALAWAFRDQLRACLSFDQSANAGRDDPPQPNQDVGGAFPASGASNVYNYNLPSSRRIKWFPGPNMVAPPRNPSNPPSYTQGEWNDGC